MTNKMQIVIGLMSGTSLDGVDAALLRTDGQLRAEPLNFVTLPYAAELRQKLRAQFGARDTQNDEMAALAKELTLAHVQAVRLLLLRSDIAAENVSLIGFHGQTLTHDPKQAFTLQIGDGALLARETGIAVINDFRTADVKAGGQGAPLVPLYHAALAASLPKPLLILNIGGVANITYLGADGTIIAADTGPGGALIDDWLLQKTGRPFDENGACAQSGSIAQGLLQKWLADEFFTKPPPKSLDRQAYQAALQNVAHLSAADGAATLTAFTAQSVAQILPFLPARPLQILVAGGGRHNSYLLAQIASACKMPTHKVEVVGWNGDATEAEAFAYLAMRSKLNLPLSLPSTTGVPQPLTGGRFYAA